MIAYGRRKDITDNNNYIGKYGVITHICPNCNNLYISNIKLNVICTMEGDDIEGYSVKTPDIEKICLCGYKTIQIDNAMGGIVKTFMDKGYHIDNCCEGHAFVRGNTFRYEYPFIKFDRYIESLIPSTFKSRFCISQKIGKTIITCNSNDNLCLCEFENYKSIILKELENLSNEIPVYDDAYLEKDCKPNMCQNRCV